MLEPIFEAHTDRRREGRSTEAWAALHALYARSVLRAPVPVLLVQPLPVQGGARETLFRQHAQRDDDAQGLGLRFRERLHRRRHAHHHDRRAVRDDRHGARELLHQGSVVGDQPEPSYSELSREAKRSRRSSFRRRAELRRRAAQADGSLRKVRLRSGNHGAHPGGEPVFRVHERRHDFQLPGANRGHPDQRHRARNRKRREPNHVLPAHGVAERAALACAHGGQG